MSSVGLDQTRFQEGDKGCLLCPIMLRDIHIMRVAREHRITTKHSQVGLPPTIVGASLYTRVLSSNVPWQPRVFLARLKLHLVPQFVCKRNLEYTSSIQVTSLCCSIFCVSSMNRVQHIFLTGPLQSEDSFNCLFGG